MDQKGIVITQTPSRISFFGGGTDFPDYFNEYGGSVIGAAIDKHVYVTINALERFFEKRIRLSYSKLEFVDHPMELKHPIVRCMLGTSFSEKDFLDIHTFADLPAASGVGSSSSFTVGLLQALYLLKGIHKTPEDIAKEAISIEREQLKDRGGWQDQIFAAFGGLIRIHFNQQGFRVEPIALSDQKKQILEDALIMVFVGGLRSSAQIQQAVMDGALSNKLAQLHQLNQQTDQAFQLMMEAQSDKELLFEFGRLMDEAWKTKRSLSDRISTDQIDEVYEKACQAGALGGKLCGAGGGGFLLMVVPPKKQASFFSAFEAYKCLKLRFSARGSHAIYIQNSR